MFGRRASNWGLLALLTSTCALVDCSFVVDSTVEQCSSSADCTGKGGSFGGTICGPDHTCGGCLTNAQCLDGRDASDPWTCRKSDHRCAQLLSVDCREVVADPKDLANDSTVFMGVMLPLVGPNASLGAPILNGAKLARSEFATYDGLIGAPGQPNRPYALVACNEAEDPIRAATHLVDDLHVPAIIGPAFSGVLIKVATTVTIRKGVLLISPSATSPFISTLTDDNLVWRTAPSDTVQAAAMVQLVTHIEGVLQTAGHPLAGGLPTKLTTVYKGDAYGTGLRDVIYQTVRFNKTDAKGNGGNWRDVMYADPPAATTYVDAAASVVSKPDDLPHIVVIVGTAEVVDILKSIEAKWPATATFKAQYVLTDGAQLPELVKLVGANDELRRRIVGTVPGPDATNWSPFDSFSKNYSAAYIGGASPDQYTAAAYDATYLLGYAAGAEATQQLTGATLAVGLRRTATLAADKILAGRGGIGEAFKAFSQNKDINYEGASGPLDFNDAGEADSDIRVWCMKADAGVASGFVNVGYYEASKKSLASISDCP